MSLLQVSRIYKREQGASVLSDISFSQQPFRKIALAGETGSGKSTLLKIIAGLAQPDSGDVLFEGERVKGPNETLLPGHPRIAYLSQHFELRHHYKVEEILEYANTLSEKEARTIYAVCQIDHLLMRKSDQLSGGEKQRIALCRLLIGAPRLLLLDEPYSNLDMIHKNTLKAVIHDIGEELGITCMLVSHDPQDSLPWADEIIILKDGFIHQQGTPGRIYRQPVSEYAAGLFGSYNLLSQSLVSAFQGVSGSGEKEKRRFVRPEGLEITTPGKNALAGHVRQVRFLGSFYEIEVALFGERIVLVTDKKPPSKGDSIFVSLSSDTMWNL